LRESGQAGNNADVATQVQPGAVLAGTYEVQRLLGEGGMGVVVAARHLARDQIVALKFMLPMALAFPQAVERFLREAKVLSVLHSEHLATVLDVGVLDNGAPYFAMEYLDGVDLGKLVRQYGALSIADAVDFVVQACAGVAEAHDHNVVHRDLKPSNLLLAQRDDGAPLVKVLDFGLSKILAGNEEDSWPASTQTQTTGTMGTPAYMSPEQARSAKNVDLRSDIWSLGAILYHLLSARLPFPAQATAEAFAKLLYEAPVPLRESAPWVSVALEGIILKCLQKDADERYQCVAELVDDLRPFCSAEDGSAGNEGIAVPHGPKKLDLSVVLQQRTMAAFEPLSLAFAGTLAQGQVDVRALAKPVSRTRRLAIMTALGGILVGGGIVIGAAFFARHDASLARPADLPGAAGQPDRPTVTAAPPSGAAPEQVAPASAAPDDRPWPGAVPADAHDAGADSGPAPDGAAFVEQEPAAAPAQTTARPDRQPGNPHEALPAKKKPPSTPDELDPFGTIH
jgi:eukaryotic-like serine/threonine-protein kinase